MIARQFSSLLPVVGAVLVLMSCAQASDPAALTFSVGDTPTRVLDLKQLESTLTVHDIALFDPHYKKHKRFRAFAIADVMDAGFGEHWRASDFDEVVLAATDGYSAVSSSLKLMESGGFLAFADLDSELGWELLGPGQLDPAPFYLVWTGDAQSTANAYPWPWQLASIAILDFRTHYPNVYPQGAAEGSEVLRGYSTFKERCVRCHAMNRQGGKIGPDLNAPMSVTEYRSPLMIREFIRHPSRYRYTHMPDHEDLSEQDLDALLDYLHYQARNR